MVKPPPERTPTIPSYPTEGAVRLPRLPAGTPQSDFVVSLPQPASTRCTNRRAAAHGVQLEPPNILNDRTLVPSVDKRGDYSANQVAWLADVPAHRRSPAGRGRPLTHRVQPCWSRSAGIRGAPGPCHRGTRM